MGCMYMGVRACECMNVGACVYESVHVGALHIQLCLLCCAFIPSVYWELLKCVCLVKDCVLSRGCVCVCVCVLGGHVYLS